MVQLQPDKMYSILCNVLVQVGFGKGTPSKTLWIDGIDPLITEIQLGRQIMKYGKVPPVMPFSCIVVTVWW